MKEGIYGFKQEGYTWLSNMEIISPFRFDGITYNSTENFYQAMKTLDRSQRKHIATLNPYKSKTYSKRVELRDDWDSVKDDVMLLATRIKYNQPKYKELLLATGNLYLEETNTWRDTYWGVSFGVGQNKLGKILMQVREEIK